MEKNLFRFSDYKLYLAQALRSRGHGAKKEFAKNCGIQNSYLSQLLSGKVELSLEQADKANLFLNHSEDEAHFFMLLVQKNRAGTVSLKNYFQSQLEKLIEKRTNLKEQVRPKSEVSDLHREKFYSSWMYAAVQIGTTIKNYQTVETLSRRMGLSTNKISEILKFLTEAGLVSQKDGRFEMSTQSTHLEKDSPLVYQHHMNWRLRCLNDLEKQNQQSLHYSTVMSLSEGAVKEIKSILSQAVKTSNETMEKSSEDLLYSLGVDFYEV
jgi:uncharacterized protein (TIGR02147 family)